MSREQTAYRRAYEEGGELLRGTGAELADAADARRAADSDVADALVRPRPRGPGASAGYLAELGSRTRLGTADERRLIVAAKEGDARARGALVEAFMPLIASVARPYRQSARVERLELLQEGVVGLLRALERYDPDREVPFWAYAGWWVRQAMQQLVSEVNRPVVLSDRALRHLSRLRDAHGAGLRESGREPGSAELADRTGLSRDHVDDLLAVDRPARSTDEPLAGEEGAVGTLGDLLVDPLAEGEYERVLEALEARELLALLSGLSERERAILRARFGLEGEPERTRAEIGESLGLSAERVRQLEQRALGKLAASAAS
ncbi:MAG TPA: sigma-70 family RNA polymerase sigma factor [Solirubrobacterales bacterium]|nr:sigma-70 family RNA polymerase sigma factor [Solirubrobacterales bacterium]